MLYNNLFTYEDKKDGKLVIRCKIPDNVFHLIEELNNYLSRFGNYKGVCFYLSPKSKNCKMWNFNTNLLYRDYMEQQDSGHFPESCCLEFTQNFG